ncbi:MAG: AMP-binding protein [Oscillospiraceae bacterium]|jgi:acetyl-CoA synthetase|nr:AMP-binding protein [Oscillospiraceae bacterium]
MSKPQQTTTAIQDVALRIRELRELTGLSQKQAAKKHNIPIDIYKDYESGAIDLPFSFIHNSALMFGVELTDLLEGWSAHLTSYAVTRRGTGRVTSKEQNIEVRDLAPRFRNKIAEPYWVTYTYSDEQQHEPIPLVSHSGQEFNIIYSGQLKVQIGDHVEILSEGDSIYYNSTTPHGMIAVGGNDCVFCAVVLPGDDASAYTAPTHKGIKEKIIKPTISDTDEDLSFTERAEIILTAIEDELTQKDRNFVYEQYCFPVTNEHGILSSISFKDQDEFNFAFDVVDAIAAKTPEKTAMLHVDRDKEVRRFSFADISRQSSRAANYFTSLGIKKGDRVMLVLKRNYQFWQVIVALHKIGAIAIPATDQLLQKDYEYRFEAAGITAIICTGQSNTANEADNAIEVYPQVTTKIMINGERDGWLNYDKDIERFRSSYPRTEDSPCGEDLMLMYFTSGTTGYPKIAAHTYTYALGHFITAKYWHNVDPDGLHYTISDTGWGKSVWGMLYGQWLCEAGIFCYDFDRFDPLEILPMFSEFGITTFCAPPTMYRFLVRDDISKYDLTTIKYLTTAGEALNPEVFNLFKKATGLSIMEGFGQTETTLMIANLVGMTPKSGSMGKPSPLYSIALMDSDGNTVGPGEVGEIVILTDKDNPCGLFSGYYRSEEQTKAAWYDGAYHTGDTAWRDEEGYLFFVGRVDDLIKSSGYRIGPFEVESVIMELPYVLECAVSPEPDETRGQVVKASIVLTKDKEPSEALKKEIQEYVKTHTAPYKYPRIVVFRESLPKTISGKIKRNQL